MVETCEALGGTGGGTLDRPPPLPLLILLKSVALPPPAPAPLDTPTLMGDLMELCGDSGVVTWLEGGAGGTVRQAATPIEPAAGEIRGGEGVGVLTTRLSPPTFPALIGSISERGEIIASSRYTHTTNVRSVAE